MDLVRIVARNCDGVIAIISLRRRGDEIRVTAARSRRVPEYQLPRYPRRGEHFLRAFQTLISHEDEERIVTRNRNDVITIISLRRR